MVNNHSEEPELLPTYILSTISIEIVVFPWASEELSLGYGMHMLHVFQIDIDGHSCMVFFALFWFSTFVE